MSVVSNAKLTMKALDKEISDSKLIELLQDAYNTIEELIYEIDTLERSNEDKDDEIKNLNDIIDDLEKSKGE